MPTTNYWWIALNAVSQKIKSLDLDGIADANVLIQEVNTDKTFPSKPGISIAPYGGEGLVPGEGGNVADDLTYPVGVVLIDSRKNDSTARLEKRLGWRQDLVDNLHHQFLAYDNGVTTSLVDGQFDTIVVPGRFTDIIAWFDRETWASPFVVGWKQRRVRP